MSAVSNLLSHSRGRGALITIASLFLLSGGLRIWDGAGPAIAREIGVQGGEESLAAATCRADPGVDAALKAIRARETLVTQKEEELADLSRALEVAEATATTKLAELQAAEQSLLKTINLSQTAAEDDLARLTAVYENMKPKDASVLFEQMAPDFAAGFLGRMRSDAAAAIMAGLSPEIAYSISVLLAGRNAKAPIE